MSNQVDKYCNLNSQLLYDKFEARYNIKYKSIAKKCFDDFKLWFKSYFKSELFVFFIIILISTLICFFIYKFNSIYKIMFACWIPTFCICSIIDYCLDFKTEEKIIADKSINEVFLEEGIEITKENLDELIKSSEHVANRESRIFRELRESKLYTNTKSLISGFLGVILVCFSSIITKGSEDEFIENIQYLCIICVLAILYMECFYIMYYLMIKTSRRKNDLYIQILKDKKLTLDLRRTCETKNARENLE